MPQFRESELKARSARRASGFSKPDEFVAEEHSNAGRIGLDTGRASLFGARLPYVRRAVDRQFP